MMPSVVFAGPYSRIGLLRSYGNLQSYWTTTKVWKLTVVLDYYEAKETYSRIGLKRCQGNLQSYSPMAPGSFPFTISVSTSVLSFLLFSSFTTINYTRNEWGRWKLHSKRVGKIETTLKTGGKDTNHTRNECERPSTTMLSSRSTS